MGLDSRFFFGTLFYENVAALAAFQTLDAQIVFAVLCPNPSPRPLHDKPSPHTAALLTSI